MVSGLKSPLSNVIFSKGFETLSIEAVNWTALLVAWDVAALSANTMLPISVSGNLLKFLKNCKYIPLLEPVIEFCKLIIGYDEPDVVLNKVNLLAIVCVVFPFVLLRKFVSKNCLFTTSPLSVGEATFIILLDVFISIAPSIANEPSRFK